MCLLVRDSIYPIPAPHPLHPDSLPTTHLPLARSSLLQPAHDRRRCKHPSCLVRLASYTCARRHQRWLLAPAHAAPPAAPPLPVLLPNPPYRCSSAPPAPPPLSFSTSLLLFLLLHQACHLLPLAFTYCCRAPCPCPQGYDSRRVINLTIITASPSSLRYVQNFG